MLAPRAPSAFVCLRCEAQIARRRLPAVTPRSSHAKFSASARRRDGADELEAPVEEPQPELKITKYVEPLNHIIVDNGKVRRETTAPLNGLKQMGRDADILVLKEVGNPPKIKERKAPEPLDPSEVPDILDSLEQDGPLTEEETQQQIENLRPKPDADADPSEPHYISQATFIKLKKKLVVGFKQSQLIAYYSAVKNLKKKNAMKGVIKSVKGEHGAAKRLIDRSEWQPGATNLNSRLPGVDVQVRRNLNVPGLAVTKQLVVDRILRDAWGLNLLEEVESLGELEMGLKPWQIMLLNSGEDESALDKIRQSRRVKIELAKKHNVLRITADKSTAEWAAKDIEEALQNTENKRMNLADFHPLLPSEIAPEKKEMASMFSQRDFNAVGKLTRTSIEAVTGSILAIRGFDMQSVEEARRTLLRLLPFKDSTIRTFDMQKLGALKSSSYLMPVYTEQSSLDHRHRNAAFGRMTMPLERLVEPETPSDQAQQVEPGEKPAKSPKTLSGLTNRIVTHLRRPATLEPKFSEIGHWEQAPEHKLSAEIGQVLFPMEDEDPMKAVEAAGKQPYRSPFLNTFPGLPSLLASPDLSATVRLQNPSLVYEFIPGPNQPNFKPGQQFPSLHIQMRTRLDGSKPVLHKLSLGLDPRVHDVLLPNKAADIRFTRYGRLRLSKTHRDKNVQEWVNTVTENIKSGGRLTAPPLELRIPKWTIPGFPAHVDAMRSVIYNFSGIQFRQTISGTFLGNNISFNTVQSGKLGVKAAALTAHYNNVDDVAMRDEDALRVFVKRCFDMVEKITDAAAQTQPLSRLIAPRHELSARKLKRRALQEEERGEFTRDLNERVGSYPQEVKDGEQDETKVPAVEPSTVEEQRVGGEEVEQSTPTEEAALTSPDKLVVNGTTAESFVAEEQHVDGEEVTQPTPTEQPTFVEDEVFGFLTETENFAPAVESPTDEVVQRTPTEDVTSVEDEAPAESMTEDAALVEEAAPVDFPTEEDPPVETEKKSSAQ